MKKTHEGKTPEQIEAYRKYHRDWYHAHRDQVLEDRKRAYAYNKQRNAERAKTWREQHPERIAEINRKSYEKRKAHYAALKEEVVILRKRVAELEAAAQ